MKFSNVAIKSVSLTQQKSLVTMPNTMSEKREFILPILDDRFKVSSCTVYGSNNTLSHAESNRHRICLSKNLTMKTKFSNCGIWDLNTLDYLKAPAES